MPEENFPEIKAKIVAFVFSNKLTVLLGIIGLALLTASFVILFRQSQDEAAQIIIKTEASSSPKTILVHIAGAVEKPGIYQLPQDSRINDLLIMANGLTQDANRAWFENNVNLAQKLIDGQKIYFPKTGEQLVSNPQAGNSLVNINTASLEELESLPEIGKVTAQKIIDYRQENGQFTSVEDLLNVPGIGDKSLEIIKNFITVY